MDERVLMRDGLAASQANLVAAESQRKLLVRHLLDRFFNNEVVSVDGEALPLIMTVAWAIALPTLVAAIFMYPLYHGIAPKPPRPPFWSQVADRYFYVMYAWVVMGAVTVFEWDLLVPNMLDVWVLSVLPIAHRRLLRARVTAVVIFLGLFLLGTSSLGIIFFPLATEPAHALRAIGAHCIAVLLAGLSAASSLLAVQGLLISILGARVFRSVSTLLQSLLMMILSITLFLFPVLARSLQTFMQSGDLAVRCFPPFWFLGIYESIMEGPAVFPACTRLAHLGYWGTFVPMAVAIVTYPLAYRRIVRQVVEGTLAPNRKTWLLQPMLRLLHGTILRTPTRRAVYHFINQTLFRSQRHRLYLAIYTGLGIALASAWVVDLHPEGNHVHIAISNSGVRLAIPALAFWVVAGLCTSLLSPADPAGSWVFRLIHGRVSSDQLWATRLWVLLWSVVILLYALVALGSLAYPELRGIRFFSSQILVALGICLLLTDIFTLQLKVIPFTEARVPRNTDLAFLLLRYIVLFPVLVLTTVQYEGWIEASALHLVVTALLIALLHVGLRRLQARMMQDWETLPEEGDESPILGLYR